MSDLEFSGTDDELAKYVREFGARAGGRVRRDARAEAWVLSFGAFLATNPNDVGFRIRVEREGKALLLKPGAIAAPWTRRKVARLVAARRAQLADYLRARLGGKDPGSFDATTLSEPFASYGSGPAALSASFAWVVAGGVAALFAALLAATIASLPLMGVAATEIVDRAAAIEASGNPALPSAGERSTIGFGFRLGAAFFFGAPMGFLVGLLHAVCLGAGEASPRASRLPQASFFFSFLSLAAALFPFTPFWAIPCALLVPAAAHAGYGLVWGMRGERRREGPRPRPALVLVALGLAAASLGALAPRPGAPIDDRLALFRDRFLLPSGIGRAFSHAYYRYTLYAADPLKEFYSDDPTRPARSQRIALAATPELATRLRGLDFALADREGPAVDARVDLRTVSQGSRTVSWDSQGGEAALRKALAELSGAVYRGGWLREVSGLAWRALFYAGPPAFILVVIGLCCPFVSVMFRAMSARGATIALAASVVSTVLLMLLGEFATRSIASQVERLKGSPERIAEALAHESPLIRHEAAHAAFRLPQVPASLSGPLMKAADDEDFRVRIWAVAALGRTGDPAALERLVARLADRELFVRYRAAEGLGFLARKEAVEPLLRLAATGSWYEGLYALQALRRIDPERF